MKTEDLVAIDFPDIQIIVADPSFEDQLKPPSLIGRKQRRCAVAVPGIAREP